VSKFSVEGDSGPRKLFYEDTRKARKERGLASEMLRCFFVVRSIHFVRLASPEWFPDSVEHWKIPSPL